MESTEERIQQVLCIRKVQKQDNSGLKQLIKTVMPEFGACGEGFAINDPEVENMAGVDSENRSVYFVLLDGENIVGGAGVAPLEGGAADVCELRKMYFLPSVRGLGKGRELLALCLNEAKRLKFTGCYLETLKTMHRARALYETFGFKRLEKPMGNTGHFSCDAWYFKKL